MLKLKNIYYKIVRIRRQIILKFIELYLDDLNEFISYAYAFTY